VLQILFSSILNPGKFLRSDFPTVIYRENPTESHQLPPSDVCEDPTPRVAAAASVFHKRDAELGGPATANWPAEFPLHFRKIPVNRHSGNPTNLPLAPTGTFSQASGPESGKSAWDVPQAEAERH
jgi:hypothetical protein